MNHHSDGGARCASQIPVHALRLRELVEMTKLSRSTLYSLIKAGSFPPGFLLAPRARGWLANDVIAWLETRAAQAQKQST